MSPKLRIAAGIVLAALVAWGAAPQPTKFELLEKRVKSLEDRVSALEGKNEVDPPDDQKPKAGAVGKITLGMSLADARKIFNDANWSLRDVEKLQRLIDGQQVETVVWFFNDSPYRTVKFRNGAVTEIDNR